MLYNCLFVDLCDLVPLWQKEKNIFSQICYSAKYQFFIKQQLPCFCKH
jgi:hypothetical protein